MEKALVDLEFNELVAEAMKRDVDSLLKGDSYKDRIRAMVELSVLWRHERTLKESKSEDWFVDTSKLDDFRDL